MLTGISSASATSRLWLAYYSNKSSIARSSTQIASGSRLNHPSDNIPDYFRSQAIRSENRQYDSIRRNMGDAGALANVAQAAGTLIFQKLGDLTSIVRQYWDPSTEPADQESLRAVFSSAIDEIGHAINGAMYDDKQLVSDNGGNPFRSVILDAAFPDTRLDISFNSSDIVDIAALQAIDIGAPDKDTVLAAVETEQAKAGSYLAKAVGYVNSLVDHSNLVQDKIMHNSQFDETINGPDQAELYVQYSRTFIQQQSTFAMLAQANVASQSVLGLLMNK